MSAARAIFGLLGANEMTLIRGLVRISGSLRPRRHDPDILYGAAFKHPPEVRLALETPRRHVDDIVEDLQFPASDKGPFKNKFRFCWRLFGLLARRERRASPQRSVRSEKRSQQAKEPQPGGAGRRRGLFFLAPRAQPPYGGWSLLPPRIWPHGAPPQIGR